MSDFTSQKPIHQIRDRFVKMEKNPYWKDIEQNEWESWAWQQQKRIRTLDQLNKVIHTSHQEEEGFNQTSLWGTYS